jgi:hypothetical protein
MTTRMHGFVLEEIAFRLTIVGIIHMILIYDITSIMDSIIVWYHNLVIFIDL